MEEPMLALVVPVTGVEVRAESGFDAGEVVRMDA
jgi:hypothetical protein